MAAAIATRRGPSERRRLAAAEATNARLNTGMAEMGSNIPIIPFAIDSCTMRDVASTAPTMTTMAPTRSDQGARLKKSHHTMIANPPATPAKYRGAAGPGHDHGDDKPDQQ